MKKNNKMKRLLAAVVCISVLAASITTVGAVSSQKESANPFIQKMDSLFQDPGMEYRPEARWWLAEGSHTDETLKESIKELYDNGFGAVEFVTLDESAYLDDARYAWGSEEWIHDSHLIMEECNKYDMGVSFTSGTHWSTANLTTITPDDQAASQELGYTTIELAAGQNFNGALPTPELTADATKMRFEKVVAAKKTSISEDGKITSLAEDSLIDITSFAKQVDGVWTIDYTAPSDGDYLLFSFWQYGTSESYKPAVTGKSYTINYFSREGIDTLIDYWDEHVLDDSMKKMIKENGDVSMYMDSMELGTHGTNSTGNLWCEDYLQEFQTRRGYDISKYLPLLIMQSNVSFTADPLYKFTIDGNDDLCAKLRNDLYQTNTELYMEECLDILRDWVNSFGMTLRAENSYGTQTCVSQSVKSIDYVETESLEFGTELDMFRLQAGATHLYGKTYSSETGAMWYENYWYNNEYYRQLFYTQFASGIQRTVVHGYSSAYGPEEHCSWPGYEGMQEIFSERFNKRQPNAIDYPELMEHVARTQKALRQGTIQMDLGILRTDYNVNMVIGFNGRNNSNNFVRQHKGYYWQDTTLQDAGYTYDYFSPMLLQDSDITCENGLIQADGVGYQALLLYQEELPYESAQVLYNWAKSGLPVVIVEGPTQEQIRNTMVKENQSAAITTGYNDGKDEQLAELMTQIKALDTVATVQTQEEAYDALISLGVHPRAEYSDPNQQNLLSVLRKDNDASYLYVYNYMYEDDQNYVGQISVDGIYKPYVLNTWTGETTELAEYSYQGDRTILNVDLAPGDIMVFALDPNAKQDTTVIMKNNVEQVTIEDGNTVMYVPDSGKSALIYSDGTTYETENNTVPEDITLDKWNLTVQDWQPGEKLYRTEDRGLGYTTTEVTYDTKKVDINVGQTELIPWKDMPQVGEDVSGVGTYTTTFTLPENWDQKHNVLIFNAESFGGGTASIFVNGQKVLVNMDNHTADLSEYVQTGENTIEVRVTSSLRNRMKEQGYGSYWSILHSNPESDSYGMVGEVVLETYNKVAVTDTEQPTPSNPSETPSETPNPSNPNQPDGTDSPQTGDTVPVFGITALLLTVGTLAIIRKRR